MNTWEKLSFAGQRVLEIGPASGFLTFEMEKRGAEVVSVEVTAEHGWDFVPYPAARLEEVFGPRRIVMQQLKNSYWFSHAALQSKAKVYYGDVYNLPAALGEFDIAVMGAVLLHCRDPLRIVEQCGKRAKSLIIVDKFHPDLEGAPVCRLAPTPENFLWHTWWHFSTQFFTQFLAVMGFTTSEPVDAPAVSPRTSAHAFHSRRAARMKYDFAPPGYVRCHSERNEESLINSGAIHTENSQRCFASLNMTALFMRGSTESVR